MKIALYSVGPLRGQGLFIAVHDLAGLPGPLANNDREHFMGYQISFEGAATAEVAQLLHAVQSQLKGHGIHAQTPTDTASTVQAASTVENCDLTKTCPDTHVGHGPEVVIAIVALVIGIFIGYYFGKRSVSPTLKS
jgi:hypothetical protein